MKKLICSLALVMLVSGCATIAAHRQLSFVNYSKNIYPPHDEKYPIDLYFQDKPQKSYEVIGEIMGFVVHDNNLRPLLETKARQIGADAFMDIETSMGTQTETDVSQHEVMDSNGNLVGTIPVSETTSGKVINIKAKAIKYK